MVSDKLAKLLILQDRDARHGQLLRQRDSIPAEREKARASIATEEARRKENSAALKRLEVQREELEGRVEDLEEAVRKYQTQQLQVKKNDEYAALEHEIATARAKISETEDDELTVLEAIDQKAAANKREEEEINERIRVFEGELKRLDEAEREVEAAIVAGRDAVTEAEAEVDPALVESYRFVKTQVKRPPYVVPLKESRCGGCHLKVSGEIESGARKGHEIVRCDNCARIVYFER
ncbi:MAG: hypothetical protein JJU00_06765 [Opitutales bacterium]|nr:hypothetical protein [Opitutales bacterium]